MIGAGEMIDSPRAILRAPGEAPGDRQSHPGAGTGARRRHQRLRRRLERLDKELAEADIVVSCTASALPISRSGRRGGGAQSAPSPHFHGGSRRTARHRPGGRRIWRDVYPFSIDDSAADVDENRREREVAAGDARLLLEEEVARFVCRVARARCRTGDPRAAGAGRGHPRPDGGPGETHAASGKSSDEVIDTSPTRSPIGCCTPRPRRCARPPSPPIPSLRRRWCGCSWKNATGTEREGRYNWRP